MTTSRYHAWVVLDVEDWSGRPAVSQFRIQLALQDIAEKALSGAGIDPRSVTRTQRGDGAILALPGSTPKERITTQFVAELREAILEYDATCAASDVIRLRLALHAGDAIHGGDQWAGRPVVKACRLVDSELLKRVLAASTGSPLAVVVSSEWYSAVIKEGHASGAGYQEVKIKDKNLNESAWVLVPGRTRPQGLVPSDEPDSGSSHNPDPDPDPARAEYIDNSVTHGDRNSVTHSVIHGDVVFGRKHDSNSGPGPARERR